MHRTMCDDVMAPFYCLMRKVISKSLYTGVNSAGMIGGHYLEIFSLEFDVLRSCGELHVLWIFY